LNWFGKPGSASGRFNIVTGIARDSKGNYLVVDKLKCAVMVFDQNFKFITQFSERGYKPGYLVAPDDIAIDNRDRIYVTQTARKGVSVFKLTY
jgi:DNA-binding beta-propeller fold protein YncE